jgi:NAD(P)-dependent dehydrogenase (short-subunit alcohol dehydrogenase family)
MASASVPGNELAQYVLVTGGSSGIGAGIVQRMVQDGYVPIVLDRIAPQSAEPIVYIETDLANPESISSALAKASDGRRIFRLVNNVGTAIPAALEDARREDLRRMMDLNVAATIDLIQALAPMMKAARFGRIVNISSRSALGRAGMGVYAATKAAVNGLTRSWALELAQHGVTINAVAPGVIATDLLAKTHPAGTERRLELERSIPAGHVGEPADIADAVSFFLSARARFVTGQVLYVCGGASLIVAT